jgi:hypothetical protein
MIEGTHQLSNQLGTLMTVMREQSGTKARFLPTEGFPELKVT